MLGKQWMGLGIAALAIAPGAWALTGIQVGTSGQTYASAAPECAMHPSSGLAPMVRAGLYGAKRNAAATVSLGGVAVATVSFVAPDATVWLANGVNTVEVAPGRHVVDVYGFDAFLAFAGQPNVCVPDTRANTVSGDLEYAQSQKSAATVLPGCAFNPASGAAQPFVNLFDNGPYLLNVSVNQVALTQLNGTTRTHVPVFLGAGLNVISAANGAASTDFYVRDGGSGQCALP